MSTENIQYSYEFQNDVRDVSSVFETMIADHPTLLSMIGFSAKATNHKHEWLEDSMAPKSSVITGFGSGDGDSTTIEVADAAGFPVNSILRFEDASGNTRTELVKVVSVNGLELTIERDYGESAGVTLLVTDIVKLVSTPHQVDSEATSGTAREPGTNYNFTEIFEDVAQIGRSALQTNQYGFSGIEDNLNYQVSSKMKEIMFRMENALVYSRRMERSSTNNGSMGGVLQYLEDGNVKQVNGALGQSSLNDVLELIFAAGGYSNNYAIVCAQNQARKISGFNSIGGSNSPVRTSQSDKSFGGYISEFQGDLPVKKGFNAEILVSPLFPKDQVAILDLNNISLSAMQEFTDQDATPKGADFVRRRILGEYTLEVRNGKKAHGLLTNLTV